MGDSNQDQVPQEPEKFETGYSENMSHEAMDPVEELGNEQDHPERFETGYSENAPVTDPTENASE